MQKIARLYAHDPEMRWALHLLENQALSESEEDDLAEHYLKISQEQRWIDELLASRRSLERNLWSGGDKERGDHLYLLCQLENVTREIESSIARRSRSDGELYRELIYLYFRYVK